MSTHRLRDDAGTLLVGVTADGDSPQVTLDGGPATVERVRTGPRLRAAGAVTDPVAFDLDGRPVRAWVTRTREQITVTLDGHTYRFATGDAAEAGATSRLGSSTTTAPMPGKVIAVAVTEGQHVEVGQSLVVIEAMKMESTLTAEVAGVVQRVAVAAGDVVEGGAVLIELAADT